MGKSVTLEGRGVRAVVVVGNANNDSSEDEEEQVHAQEGFLCTGSSAAQVESSLGRVAVGAVSGFTVDADTTDGKG